jgi:uncharacterized paraquat-inducible protein A
MAQSVHYCWHCYAENERPSGACSRCGHSIDRPADTSYTEQLIWALGHPLPGTQMIAAQVLGARRDLVAEQPLRQLVVSSDPFLAAQALDSLVAIVGVAGARDLLEPLAESGPPAVQSVAIRALNGGAR